MSLEYKGIFEKKGIKFMYKYTDPYMPIQSQHDRHFPAIENLDYDN